MTKLKKSIRSDANISGTVLNSMLSDSLISALGKVYVKFYTEFIAVSAITSAIEMRLRKVVGAICGKKVFIVGNGGSAAIASHVAEDFTKLCGVPTITLHDPALMSCFANDYGWENWVAEAVKQIGCQTCDVGIFISSSGESKNMINGCDAAKNEGLTTITFTGFSPHNALRQLGDINFHVPSRNYNVVEVTHELWLLSICEILSKF